MQPIPREQNDTADTAETPTHAQIEREAQESKLRVRKVLQAVVDRQARRRKHDLKPELRASDLPVDQLVTSS